MAAAAAASYANHPNYFGDLSRLETEQLLKDTSPGTFLIRKSSRGKHTLCISLRQSTQTLHFLVLQRGQGFGLDPDAWKTKQIGQETFPSLQLLVSRLKQIMLLVKGLTSPASTPGSQPDASGAQSDTLPSSNPSVEKAGSINKEELKKQLAEANSSKAAAALEAEYKGMLSAMVRDKLTSDEISTLKQWRDANGISDDTHTQVLASLGLTLEQFEQLKDFSSTKNERELCVICLEGQKSAVFVDCGHMATCFDCAQRIESCPICRHKKTNVIRVFQ